MTKAKMARVKKTDATVVSTSASEEASAPAAAEKKPRKENQWNAYFKAEYPKFKGSEEHKSKSHSELTKIISQEYKKKKEQPAAAAEQQSE